MILVSSSKRSHSVGSLANQSLPHSEVEAKEGKVMALMS